MGISRHYLLVFILFCGSCVYGQSLPVGMHVLEDIYRREQLTGNGDSSVSFMVRPLFTGNWHEDRSIASDTLREKGFIKFKHSYRPANGKSIVQLLPVTWLQQYNDKIPYGWNDASFIPASGYQTQFSLGVYAKYGPISLQVKPELISAENKVFEGLPTDQHNIIWAKYYDNYFNVTDIPERFGEDPYTKLFWGQSSLRLTFDPVSVGISTENLYWGPGMRNSLVMGNTAPGFKHITLNTTKPVNTPVGSFEAQMVAGWLVNSGFSPPEVNRIYEGRTLYVPKEDDGRYLSGFVLSYNPKWVPGLFIGASRTSQVYHQDVGSKVGDFFPLLQAVEKKDDGEKREYLSSLFFRWIWKEAQMEIYGEYGHNAPRKFKEFLVDPEFTAAYLMGLRKLFPLNKHPKESIQFGLEVTQLQQAFMPGLGGWYTSNKIRQGYTNNGQVMGAGIGPGSNLQSLNISWVKGIKRVGFQVERYVHNNDLYYQIFQETLDFRRHWVDISYGLSGEWDYKNLLINASASMIRNMNYHYVLFNRPVEYFVPGLDFMDYQAKVGVTYRF